MFNETPSRAVYFVVFIFLMALLSLTVGAAYLHLGRLNAAVALCIAFVKAILVVLYFMHARYTGRLIRLVVGGACVWLSILVGLTLSDYLSRGWLSN